MAPVVGHKTCETQTEAGLLVAGMWFVVRMHRDNRHFPIAPVARSLLMDRWVRVHEEPMIGFDEAAVPFCHGHTVAETGPLFGKESPETAGYPIDSQCRGGADAEKHHFGHVSRMLFGVSER